MAYTDTEIEDLIKKAKCCAKPKFVEELPETVVEGRFIILEDVLYVGHEGVWASLGIVGEGVANTLAFWDDVNSLDSAVINTGITFNDGVINSSFRDKKLIYTTMTSFGATWVNIYGSTTGTWTYTTPTFINWYTTNTRLVIRPSSAVVNSIFGPRAVSNQLYRGSLIPNTGGFNFFLSGGVDTWTDGSRFFCGFATGDSVVIGNPSVFDNTVGFAVDDTDAGQIYFLTRDTTSATKQPTGFTLSNNEGFNFEISCEPSGSSYSWKITSLNNGTSSSGVATLTLPIVDTLMAPRFLGSNGAIASTTSIEIGFIKAYIEATN